jgi:cytochrome c-type biogenesis protein CcsB
MTKTVQRELPDGSRVQSADTYREYEGGPILTRVEVVPGAALSCGIGMLAFLLAAAFALRSRGAAIAKNAARFYALGLVSQVALFACIGRALATSESLTLHSNTYLLFLLLMTFIFCGIFVILWWRLEKFLTLLPSAQRLDELSYKNILFAFPFQTLLLVTGAIWAYYAWGRSWGWDPKETWAFITWVAYLIYLHGKLLLRWSPNLLSIVSLIGFFILVFAFLGVNLVLSGLHSYGSV